MIPSQAREPLMESIRSALEPLSDVRLVYLFGSRARGKVHARSDLDLAVLLAAGLDSRERTRLSGEITFQLAGVLGSLGERADIVDLARVGSAIAFRVLKEGCLVFARSHRERVVAEARIYSRYHDDAPRRALYQRAAIVAARKLAGAAGG